MVQTSNSKKRENILKATEELILQYGTEKITIRDIAREAKVSQVTIYNHFTGKENLIGETIHHLIDELINDYKSIVHGPGDFKEKLSSVFHLRKKVNQNNLWYSLTAIAEKDPLIADKLNSVYYKKMKEELLNLIKQGLSEKEIRSDISEEAILLYIEIFKNHYMDVKNIALYTESPKLVDDIWKLFWNGLNAK